MKRSDRRAPRASDRRRTTRMSGAPFAWVLVLLGTFANPTPAIDRWVSHGPYGGSTAVLLPSNGPDGGFYAGVLGYGVYKVPAGSDVWIERSEGLGNLFVKALVQDPQEPATLYAGTRSGVWWTTDEGLTWEPRSGGIGVSYAEALAIDPVHPDVLYAGAIWEGDWHVYKTTDAGETWHATGPGIPVGLHITCLLVDPIETDVVYAGTEDPYNYFPDEAGVYKSVDGGQSWLPSGTGLLNAQVRTLTFDPVSSRTLYAGMYGNEYIPHGGVYISRNGGAGWSRISSGLPTSVELSINAIAVAYGDKRDVPVLYAAGSYDVSLPPPPGTWEPRLYRSTNGGASWQPAAEGIAYPDLLSVAADSENPSVVYAGSNCGGVFRSTDAGDHWSHWSDGLAPLRVASLGVHPDDESIVYAGTLSYLDEWSAQDAGVFVSFDGGVHWEPRPRKMRVGDSFHVSSLAVTTCVPDPGAVLAANAGWMLYKSVDEGLTWDWRGLGTGLDGYWLMCVVVDPTDPDVAYVSGAGFEPSLPDVYKTTDCGESWTPTASDLVWAEFAGLAIDPTDTRIVYAGSAWEGVYKTTNGGVDWFKTGPEIDAARAKSIVVDPRSPQTVYAGDNQWDPTGVWVSYDGGGGWQLFNDGLSSLDVEALALDSVANGGDYPVTLFAGTEAAGVFHRQESAPWREMNTGLTDLRVYALALGPPAGPRALYAGTAAGAYRWIRSGDFDADGDVDLDDLDAFAECYTGSDADLVEPGCEAGDFDGDGDIDCVDWASFKEVWPLRMPPVFASCPDGCCHGAFGAGDPAGCSMIFREEDCADGWVVNVCLGDFDGSGIDDACDPIRDLAVAWEAGSPGPSNTTVEWAQHASVGHADVRYDLVRGDLGTLVAGGDFTGSVELCVADDHSDVNVLFFDEDPTPGEGQWFLVRGVWVTPDLLIHPMTYDTWVVDLPSGVGQHETRDPGIEASPLTCP